MFDLKKIHKKFNTRLLIVWTAAVLLFFVALADFKPLDQFARQASLYFPFIENQFEKATLIGSVAGRYFSLAALLLPFATVYLVRGLNISAQAKASANVAGSRISQFLVILLIGVPFLLSMLALIYFAPFELSADPRLFGQVIAHSAMNSYLGLLIFGSILIVAISLLLVMLFLCFFALSAIFSINFKGGNK
jgi:hypothetical protein